MINLCICFQIYCLKPVFFNYDDYGFCAIVEEKGRGNRYSAKIKRWRKKRVIVLKKKIIEKMKILNILLIWSLEESIIRARSMRARGYGVVNKRSFYFNYRMDKLDIFVLFLLYCLYLH